jgi:putative tryptophan/tyrosine transport system substrate-binding protein
MAGPDPISPLARAFVHGLRDFGWIGARPPSSGGRRKAKQRAPGIFAELISRGVDVIAMGGSRWLREAAQQATQTLPIVALFDADPVIDGIVSSLARPGGRRCRGRVPARGARGNASACAASACS